MNPDLLFDVPEQLSPRLAWLLKHKLELHQTPRELVGQESPETGVEMLAWFVVHDRGNLNFVFRGNDADEACANAAQRMGLKLWFEENP